MAHEIRRVPQAAERWRRCCALLLAVGLGLGGALFVGSAQAKRRPSPHAASAPAPSAEPSPRAARASAPSVEPSSRGGLVDLHVDLSYQHNYRSRPFEEGSGQFGASHLLSAGVRGVVLPLFVPASVSKTGPTLAELERSYENVMDRLSKSTVYLLPGTPKQPGRVQTWLAFEGAAPVATDLDLIPQWVKRGVRVFGLVHTSDNSLAASATGTSQAGLTDLGKQFVERVHQSGGIIDVSHASRRAALEVAKIAARDGVPAIATHSNAYALASHPRNLTDEAITALAQTGGIIGVNFHSPFLRRQGRASIADVVAHILHLRRRVGVSHVAIGSDFEGGIVPARGLETVDKLGDLVAELHRAGLSAEELDAVLGGNALRVLGSPGFSPASEDGRRGASVEVPANGIPVP